LEIVEMIDPFRNGAVGMIDAEEQALIQQLVVHALSRLSTNPFCLGL
jgi:hypothetical protein